MIRETRYLILSCHLVIILSIVPLSFIVAKDLFKWLKVASETDFLLAIK
jgi:hypothetical protein